MLYLGIFICDVQWNTKEMLSWSTIMIMTKSSASLPFLVTPHCSWADFKATTMCLSREYSLSDECPPYHSLNGQLRRNDDDGWTHGHQSRASFSCQQPLSPVSQGFFCIPTDGVMYLLSRAAGDGPLDLQQGAADLVADRNLPSVVRDCHGRRSMTMLTTGAAREDTAATVGAGGFGSGHGSCPATSAEETASGAVRTGGGCGGVVAAGKHVWDLLSLFLFG
jgi:hypothetical protein